MLSFFRQANSSDFYMLILQPSQNLKFITPIGKLDKLSSQKAKLSFNISSFHTPSFYFRRLTRQTPTHPANNPVKRANLKTK